MTHTPITPTPTDSPTHTDTLAPLAHTDRVRTVVSGTDGRTVALTFPLADWHTVMLAAGTDLGAPITVHTVSDAPSDRGAASLPALIGLASIGATAYALAPIAGRIADALVTVLA